MRYNVNEQVSNLRNLLLGKISYNEWKKRYLRMSKKYKVVFESDDFKEFSNKLYDFFDDKKMVRARIIHEKKHFKINEKYGIRSKFILKTYERDGEMRYRPSVVDADKVDKKEEWPKKKLWKYYYEQTSMKDVSDSDKKIRDMLLGIKVFVE
jgi:hypothetical protein